MTPEEFASILKPYLQEWPIKTRLHPSNDFFPGDCYIKREDEQSGGIIGAKYRKYASLVAYWYQAGINHLIIHGSAFSNNVLGLIQLANEHGLTYELKLLTNQSIPTLQGNHLWIRIAARKDSVIHYLTPTAWHQLKLPSQLKDGKTLTIPEGALMPQALKGSLTLGPEILKQEAEADLAFYHIFMDSGTGLSAFGLLLSLACVGATNKTIHITLIAGTLEGFQEDLLHFQKSLGELGISFQNLKLPTFYCYSPVSAQSFGAINKTILEAVQTFAQTEGILTDPVYGAKHAMTASSVMSKQSNEGGKLFIHNSGALALSGFQERLGKVLNSPQ